MRRDVCWDAGGEDMWSLAAPPMGQPGGHGNPAVGGGKGQTQICKLDYLAM